jgi:sugar phosphate isomerase/epimerase
MKFGICNEIFQDWPLDEAFAYAAKVGYDCIEIAPFTIKNSVTDISAAGRQRIKDLAAEKGIAISGIHWVLVQTEGLHLTHPDAEVRARTARYFVDLVDFCGDIGGTRIIVGSPKQRSLQTGVTMSWRGNLRRMCSAIPCARRRSAEW